MKRYIKLFVIIFTIIAVFGLFQEKAEAQTVEDFEAGFGDWVNGTGTGDDCVTRNSGETSSSDTGPSTGDNSTWYIYWETSSSACNGSNNDFMTYTLPSTGGGHVSFSYHMYGADMGTLSLEAFDGSTWTEFWSISGQQHTSHTQAYTQVDGSAVFPGDTQQIRFFYTGATGFTGDAAVDNVAVVPTVSSFTDNFSSSQYISADSNYSQMITVGSADLQAVNGRLENGTCGSNEGAAYRTASSFSSPDYEVSVVMQSFSSTRPLYLITRAQDNQNFYALEVHYANSSWVRLFRVVDGTWSSLGNLISSDGLSSGDTVRLRVSGSSISVIWDNLIQATVNDSTFTSAGYAGFGMGGIRSSSLDCSVQTLDNFTVSTTFAPLAPTVTTQSATNITVDSADLRSSVNPNGNATSVGYRYGISETPLCTSLPNTASYGSIGSGTSTVSYNVENITGLTEATTYYYCAYATNTAGTTYGSMNSFATSFPYTAQTEGANSPSLGVSDNTAGTVGWSSPQNIYVSDNVRASSSNIGEFSQSYYLKATDFGFNIPSAATIHGVEVSVERYYTRVSGSGTAGDYRLQLLAGGELTGENMASWSTDNLPLNTESAKAWGGQTDRWGATLTPEIVNASDFGVVYQVRNTASSSNDGHINAYVDNISITITYTTPPYPVVTTDAASNITYNSVTLNGTANPNSDSSTGWFRYYTSDPGTCSDSGGVRVPSTLGTVLGSGSSGVEYNENVTGLSAETTYYVCAFASNSNGTGAGSPVSFTTDTDLPQDATSESATGVNSYYVTLVGTVNPSSFETKGHFRVFTTNPGGCSADSGGLRFPYNPDGSQDVVIGSQSTTQNFSYTIPLDGGIFLQPNTTYYYCSYATNDNGFLGSSNVTSFTTPNGPASPCDPPASGNFTVPSGAQCSFNGSYAGVDVGTDATNTGHLEISANAVITIGAGQDIGRGTVTIRNGASVTLANGSSIKRGGIFVHDKDGDGILDSRTMYIGSTPSASTEFVRRNTIASNYDYAWKIASAGATLDCDPNNASAYRNPPVAVVVDADNDGYKTSASATTSACVGDASQINGRTYYADSSGSYTWLVDSQKLSSTTDCYDNSAAPCPPSTPSVGSPTQTSLSVSWSPTTGPSATSYNLQWCSGASCTPSTTINGVTSAYSHTGRTCGTTYRYRVIAVNSSGSSTASSIGQGTTSSCVTSPTVTTNAATSVTNSSATLNGTANPNGADATGWFRRYTSDPGTCTDSGGTRIPSSGGTSLGSGTSNVNFNQSASGLSDSVTYYYCAFASNSLGTGTGSVQQFTTLKDNGVTCSSGNECGSGHCYVDNDGDRRAPSSGTATCRGLSQISSNGADCMDTNSSVYSGQTSYFSTDRGDGSFDYDCSGSGAPQYTCTTSYSSNSCSTTSFNSGVGWAETIICGQFNNFIRQWKNNTCSSSDGNPGITSCSTSFVGTGTYYFRGPAGNYSQLPCK